MANKFVFEEIFDGGSGTDTGGGNTGGDSVELDTTLTQQGKAADAKAVGDALEDYAKKTDLKEYATEGYVDEEIDTAISGKIDTTLTEQGKAADAKATGERFMTFEENITSLIDEIRNLTAKLPESGGTDDSVIGTWVFNETLTSALTVIDTQEKFDHFFDVGYYFGLKGYVATVDGQIPIEEIQCVYFDSTFEIPENEIIYEEGTIELNETNDAFYYYPEEGWYNREIIITEQPSPEVAAWLEANAKKVSADCVIVVDELPTENIDINAFYLCNGEYYKFAGTDTVCVFNDEITTIPEELHDRGVYFGYSVYIPGEGVTAKMDYIWFSGISLNYYGDEGGDGYCVDDAYVVGDGWGAEEYKTITIHEEPTDEAFIAWLEANATKDTINIWQKYTPATPSVYDCASVDELPSDALENSVAFVRCGVQLWQFSGDMPRLPDTMGHKVIFMSAGGVYNRIGSTLDYFYYGSYVAYCYTGSASQLGWKYDKFRELLVFDGTADETVAAWLNEYADPMWHEDGYVAVYNFKNGEWVPMFGYQA